MKREYAKGSCFYSDRQQINLVTADNDRSLVAVINKEGY